MPKRTIELLDQLHSLGFSDEDLRVVHHMPDATIHGMKVYCEKTGAFLADRRNEKVRERLELVLAAFKAGLFSEPAKPRVFRGLAKATKAEIPIEQ